MRNNKLPEAIGIIVSFCGISVMVGWFLDIGVLKSILPVFITMKFSTALSFFFCGAILYFIARFQKGEQELAIIVIPIISMIVCLLMVSLLVSAFGINVDIEQMFVKEAETAVKTTIPGRPSVATMISFLLVSLAGLTLNFNIKRLKRRLTIVGIIVGLMGSIAVFGYVFNQSIFCFLVPGLSNPMAVHTAILFVLLGTGLILTARHK